MADRTRSIALSPDASFEAVDAALRGAGCPLQSAETFGAQDVPDRAVWSAPGGGEIVWVRDVASGLVTLVALDGASLPSSLPRIARSAIRLLLASAEPACRLAGLQAVAIGADMALLPEVAARLGDPEPAVADEAASALSTLAEAAAGEAWRAAAADPVAAVFSVPGWRSEKLQVLRWLGQEGATPGAVEGLLRHALADADWEIAVTAMVVAGRCRVAGLGHEVTRLRLPTGRAAGLMDSEGRLLLALRDACLARFGLDPGKARPEGVDAVLDGNVLALPLELRPTAAALTHPLPETDPPPVPPLLRDLHSVAFVAAVPHWLGDAALARPRAIRQVTPVDGFWIDATPRGPATLGEALVGAAAVGAGATVATADEREMALRGPDGRRFPWGMNPSMRVDLSPWGLSGIALPEGEWVAPGPAGEVWFGGGKQMVIAADLRDSEPTERRFYRYRYTV